MIPAPANFHSIAGHRSQPRASYCDKLVQSFLAQRKEIYRSFPISSENAAASP
jgi:hypothetical protein